MSKMLLLILLTILDLFFFTHLSVEPTLIITWNLLPVDVVSSANLKLFKIFSKLFSCTVIWVHVFY